MFDLEKLESEKMERKNEHDEGQIKRGNRERIWKGQKTIKKVSYLRSKGMRDCVLVGKSCD